MYNQRTNIPHKTSLINNSDISGDYILSVGTYVKPEEEKCNIDIIEVNKSIERVVNELNTLRNEVNKIIGETEVIE